MNRFRHPMMRSAGGVEVQCPRRGSTSSATVAVGVFTGHNCRMQCVIVLEGMRVHRDNGGDVERVWKQLCYGKTETL